MFTSLAVPASIWKIRGRAEPLILLFPQVTSRVFMALLLDRKELLSLHWMKLNYLFRAISISNRTTIVYPPEGDSFRSERHLILDHPFPAKRITPYRADNRPFPIILGMKKHAFSKDFGQPSDFLLHEAKLGITQGPKRERISQKTICHDIQYLSLIQLSGILLGNTFSTSREVQ